MRIPRNLSGSQLASSLNRYGYVVTRQTGSHMRLTSSLTGKEHHITIPAHDPLKVGTLNAILIDVATYLELSKSDLITQLFE